MAVTMKIVLCIAAVALSCQGNVIPDNTLAEPIQPRVGMFNEYYVYTRSHLRNPVTVLPIAASITASPIALASDTVIIVHGAGASALSSLNVPLKDDEGAKAGERNLWSKYEVKWTARDAPAFLSTDDYNIITVDWSIFANQGYVAGAASVPRIGASLAEFIDLLVVGERVELDRLHLIGHGLGAHVVGVAARTVDGTVARITGLDPAGNGWDSNSQRLTTTDADFVEVIHTDGFGTNANGIGEQIGHLDFFANGGRSSQPGCSNNECSHIRAWQLFESSIRSDHLIGTRCDTLALMNSNRCVGPTEVMGGAEYIKWSSGVYRVNTLRVYPY